MKSGFASRSRGNFPCSNRREGDYPHHGADQCQSDLEDRRPNAGAVSAHQYGELHAAPSVGSALAFTVLRMSTMLSTSASANTDSGPVSGRNRWSARDFVCPPLTALTHRIVGHALNADKAVCLHHDQDPFLAVVPLPGRGVGRGVHLLSAPRQPIEWLVERELRAQILKEVGVRTRARGHLPGFNAAAAVAR